MEVRICLAALGDPVPFADESSLRIYKTHTRRKTAFRREKSQHYSPFYFHLRRERLGRICAAFGFGFVAGAVNGLSLTEAKLRHGVAFLLWLTFPILSCISLAVFPPDDTFPTSLPTAQVGRKLRAWSEEAKVS